MMNRKNRRATLFRRKIMVLIILILSMLVCFLAGVVYEDEKTIKSLTSMVDILELSLVGQIKKRIRDDWNVKEEKQKEKIKDRFFNCLN
jgi:predicted Holliday junction resolvase-like endonuclease